MPTASAVITVSHSQYWIIDRGFDPEIEASMYRDFNGLVSAQGAFAIAMTGTEQGPIRLGVDVLARNRRLPRPSGTRSSR